MIRTLSLFSGIGGFDLGLERTGGFKTVAFCEIDRFCRRVLAMHWPEVPCFDDIRAVNSFPAADCIVAGFPCQGFSKAGRSAGLADARSGLFWELVRAIRLVRPRFAIMENVAALLKRGMGDVVGAMAESGLDTEWDCLPAYSVGSPQERDRVWIVAHANGEGKLQPGWCFRHFWGRPDYRGSESDGWKALWTDRAHSLGRVVDGVSRGLDAAAALGNTNLPQIPELIGRAILAAEASP